MIDEIFDRNYQAARADLNAGIRERVRRPRPQHRRQHWALFTGSSSASPGQPRKSLSACLTEPRGARASTHRAPRL